MALPAEKRRYTFADVLTWDESEQVEIIGGEVFMRGTPPRLHQEISGEMFRQLSVAMMPLRSNVPAPGSRDWQLTTCPHCGRECWYQTENAKTLKAFQPDIKFLCTECALTAPPEWRTSKK